MVKRIAAPQFTLIPAPAFNPVPNPTDAYPAGNFTLKPNVIRFSFFTHKIKTSIHSPILRQFTRPEARHLAKSPLYALGKENPTPEAIKKPVSGPSQNHETGRQSG
jgi:hypothetical protein